MEVRRFRVRRAREARERKPSVRFPCSARRSPDVGRPGRGSPRPRAPERTGSAAARSAQSTPPSPGTPANRPALSRRSNSARRSPRDHLIQPPGDPARQAHKHRAARNSRPTGPKPASRTPPPARRRAPARSSRAPCCYSYARVLKGSPSPSSCNVSRPVEASGRQSMHERSPSARGLRPIRKRLGTTPRRASSRASRRCLRTRRPVDLRSDTLSPCTP